MKATFYAVLATLVTLLASGCSDSNLMGPVHADGSSAELKRALGSVEQDQSGQEDSNLGDASQDEFSQDDKNFVDEPGGYDESTGEEFEDAVLPDASEELKKIYQEGSIPMPEAAPKRDQ